MDRGKNKLYKEEGLGLDGGGGGMILKEKNGNSNSFA